MMHLNLRGDAKIWRSVVILKLRSFTRPQRRDVQDDRPLTTATSIDEVLWLAVRGFDRLTA